MVSQIIPSTDPRLGRHIEHDPQSRKFAFTAPAEITLKSVKHERFIPILDQGNLGSCTGNTAVGVAGSHPHYPLIKNVITDWSEAFAIDVYSEATTVDEFNGTYPPEDTGSSGLAVAKVLQRRGLISGYRHTFTLSDMKAALQETPVLLGINWYSNFFYPDRNGFITIGDTSVAGGHEICVDEINMEGGYFEFPNSWGTAWGLNGRGRISFETMQRLLDEQGDVVVPVPITQPAPTPDPVIDEPVVPPFHPSLWTRFWTWLMKLFGA